jgi:predicted dinucleotide-binding enzyme
MEDQSTSLKSTKIDITTAIIGVGTIGSRIARNLVRAGERIVLADHNQSRADALASELGDLARSTTVPNAIFQANTIVFAVFLDAMKKLISDVSDSLIGKVVIDPSNPVGPDDHGGFTRRTLPEGVSAASIIAPLLPPGAHYVKAFGTLGGESLSSEANRQPKRAVLFYATDDATASVAVERLIHASGFDAVKVGGVASAGRIELMGGDLHEFGGLNGKLLNIDEARNALSKTNS